jgi:hypothetical protein
VADLKERIGDCAGRTVADEFGAPMTTGLDYNKPAPSNNYINYVQAVTDTFRRLRMGSVYWPGLRTDDTYSLQTLTGDPARPWLATTNQSGADRRLRYPLADMRDQDGRRNALRCTCVVSGGRRRVRRPEFQHRRSVTPSPARAPRMRISRCEGGVHESAQACGDRAGQLMQRIGPQVVHAVVHPVALSAFSQRFDGFCPVRRSGPWRRETRRESRLSTFRAVS